MALRITEIYWPELSTSLALRLFLCRVPAGFPSPADDYLDEFLDLNKKLCPDGVYTAKVDGIKVRSDGVHLTPEGVKLLTPWLEESLR